MGKEEEENGRCLDLLEQCMRAVGEIQVLTPAQTKLLGGSEKSFGSVLLGLDCVQRVMEPLIPPGGDMISYPVEQQGIISSTPVEVVLCYELLKCDPPTKSTSPNRSNIDTISNWKMFVDTKAKVDEAFVANVRQPDLDEISVAQKEIWYWALKMRNRDSCMVPAILDAAKQMNYKEWRLPNGIKVGIDDVKPLSLEVIPTHTYIFQLLKYYQTGGIVQTTGKVITPCVRLDEELFREQPYMKLFMRDIIPEGITRMHYVIEARLPHGGSYIVDPTSLQYNFRGPRGSLVAHGTWEEYANGFPGTIIRHITQSEYDVVYVNHDPSKPVYLDTASDEMYYIGEGPLKFITRLKENLITYKDRRFCGYCGWIEGPHQVRAKTDCRYQFKAVILYNCGRCNKVCYCDKMCQKAHWKAHKKICRK